ncbi:TPA: helix-turn-helix domain-containing protein [Legionella pneumophila]|nr:helix-turn-helix domain-containing protein [Legionella pneumophila]HBD9283237.1 helix-turn-helix domain-containing protein [Legionella pneumophila]
MNIKKEIGKRIFEARKEKGLTLKELGKLTGGLKQTRLTNWEQGTRAPGPEEIKLLAQALDVSPAFLMCLSDDKQVKAPKSFSQLVPLLDHCQSCEVKLHINAAHKQELSGDMTFISVSTELLPELSDNAFAIKMVDDSMMPDIRVGDVLIVEPDSEPKPGDIVVAQIEAEEEVIVRKYKQLSASKNATEYELATLNNDWADIQVGPNKIQAEIIGCIVSLVRGLKKLNI